MAQAKCVLWLTRASGAAEAGLARRVESELKAMGYGAEALDAADAGGEPDEADGAHLAAVLEEFLARNSVVVIDAQTSASPAVREGLSRRTCPLVEVSVQDGEGESEEVVRRVVAELEPAGAGGDAAAAQDGYNAEEEEEIRRRLEDLGYL